MKRKLTLVFPLILLVAALFTFGVRGGTASAASSPNVTRSSCGLINVTFMVSSDYGADLDCFTGTGQLNVAIYNVDWVATLEATGYLRWYDSKGGSHQWNFPYMQQSYSPSGVNYLPEVYFIYLS